MWKNAIGSLKVLWHENVRERLERTPPVDILEEGPDKSDKSLNDKDQSEATNVLSENVNPGIEKVIEIPSKEHEDIVPDSLSNLDLSDTGLPSVEFMASGDDGNQDDMERELDALGEVLIDKLKTFRVESEISGRTTGPVVTQY